MGRRGGEDTLTKSFNDLFLISIFQALGSAAICFSLLAVFGKEADEYGPSESFHFVRSQKIQGKK